QQRIIGEVDARDDMGGAERYLLGLGEEVVGVAVEHHLADRGQRNELFRNQLGGVEDVEREARCLLLCEQLEAQLPLREGASLDGLPQVAPVKVRVSARDLDRLVPVE